MALANMVEMAQKSNGISEDVFLRINIIATEPKQLPKVMVSVIMANRLNSSDWILSLIAFI